jgi:hypothetical protein
LFLVRIYNNIVFYGVDTVINIILELLNHTNSKIDACVDYNRPSLAIEIVLLREAFLNAKGVQLFALLYPLKNRPDSSGN